MNRQEQSMITQDQSYDKDNTLDNKHHHQYDEQFMFTIKRLPASIGKKLTGIVQQLNSDKINMQSLKTYLSEGISDQAVHIPSYCWKVILQYLPPEKSKWRHVIQKENKNYEDLVNMFLPREKFQDYPLNLKKNHPRLQQLQKDFLLWEQIQKDTSRTHAEFTFFARQSKEILIPYFTSARRQKFKLIYGDNQQQYDQFLINKEKQRKTYRYDYMTRILYIYAKLNPRIQYVQGMNEILAPIFYLVNVNRPADQIQEASCFLMFNNAISDILELHIKDLDKSKNGVYGKLNEVNQMLIVIDCVIWKRLEQLKIDSFFYCFRWVTLLYAQDFALFDTMRIWQSIFSKDDRCTYISLFAISILISCKQFILKNDFSVVLEYMQKINQNINIHEVIHTADYLYSQYKNTNFNIQAAKLKQQYHKQQKQRNKKLRQKRKQMQKQKQKQKQKMQKSKKIQIQQQMRQLKKQNKKKKKNIILSQNNQKQQVQLVIMQNKQKQNQQIKQNQIKQQTKPQTKQSFFKKFTKMVDKIIK